MSAIANLVRAARKAKKMSQEDLAEATRYSVAGIRKIESGKVRTVRKSKEIRAALGIERDQWVEALLADGIGNAEESVVEAPPHIVGLGLVPVVGRAAAMGEVGKLVMLNEVSDYVQRPPELEGVPDGYAVYVYGESMVPRYFPNEKVYVHPHRPVARGDFCVVQIGNPNPECAYIKRFVSMDESEIRLEQYNPPKEIAFPRDDVHSIGRIVGSGSA